MSPLERLISRKPNWIETVYIKSDWALVCASIELWSAPFFLSLSLSPASGAIDVGETSLLPKQLPCFCFERHIMPSGRFCIASDTNKKALTVGYESVWWTDLYEFLENQYIAKQKQYWPFERGMSHSAIGQSLQLEIEDMLSDDIQLRDEYLEGAFGDIGWLSSKNPLISLSTPRPLLKRSPCPRGCRTLHGSFRADQCKTNDCAPKCRRQHEAILVGDCPRSKSLRAVAQKETLRRQAERELYDGWRSTVKCCGSMKICPLLRGNEL